MKEYDALIAATRQDDLFVADIDADPWQGDAHRITVLATYGALGAVPDDVRTTATAPDLPPPED